MTSSRTKEIELSDSQTSDPPLFYYRYGFRGDSNDSSPHIPFLIAKNPTEPYWTKFYTATPFQVEQFIEKWNNNCIKKENSLKSVIDKKRRRLPVAPLKKMQGHNDTGYVLDSKGRKFHVYQAKSLNIAIQPSKTLLNQRNCLISKAMQVMRKMIAIKTHEENY